MKIDQEADRAVWLMLLEKSQFLGQHAEEIVRLKRAVREAEIDDAGDGAGLSGSGLHDSGGLSAAEHMKKTRASSPRMG